MRIDPNAVQTAPKSAPVNDTMRRLQIGIAGVLTVLLLVGMAGLIGDRARESVAASGGDASEVKMPSGQAASGAPLEELGVQPVSPSPPKDENAISPVKIPQIAPSTATVPDLEPDPALERARQSNR